MSAAPRGHRLALARLRARLRGARTADPLLFHVRCGLAAALGVLVWIVLEGDPASGVPERLAEGKHVRPVDYWRTQGWWVALVEAGVVAGLLLTSRLWLVREPVPRGPGVAGRAPGEPPRWPRRLVALVAAALLVGGWLAAPRLPLSLWDDEEYNVAHSIDGAYVPDGAGGLHFREASWRQTLWHYERPNNHVPHTILARLGVGAWRLVARPEDRFVSETAVRVPAFLAGLASIAAVAVLLVHLGQPAAAVVAAWLLALHPWHMKYTSEARGYSLSFLGVSGVLWLALRALERGTWRRWSAFAVAQTGLLWVNPGALWFLVLANAAIGVTLLRRLGLATTVRTALPRWGVPALLGALAWTLLMTPNLCQLTEYLAATAGSRNLGMPWLRQTGAYLSTGMPWSHRVHSAPIYPELADRLADFPLASRAALGLLGAALAAGVVRGLWAGGPLALVAAVAAATPVATYAFGALQDANMYTWYLVWTLPLLALLVALGATWPGAALRGAAGRGRVGSAAAVAAAVALLASLTWLQAPARASLRERSFKPGLEATLLTRDVLDPHAPANEDVITATFCSEPIYYDPLARELYGADDLRRAMAEARARGAPLYVNAGRPGRMRKYWQEMLALLEDRGRFERVATLHAVEPPWTRIVWRYTGSGAAALGRE